MSGEFIRFIARISVLIAALFGVACAAGTPVSSGSVAATRTVGALIAPTPNVTTFETRLAPTRTPITTTSAITLTLWTTEDLAPGATPAGAAMQKQFDAFRTANPNIQIEIVLKKPYGKGGLLDFLLTTNGIVPAHLPDLITLDLTETAPAASAGALQPLDNWLTPESRNDLFPFAKQSAYYQNQWFIVPFAIDTQHLVYNKTLIKKAPATWDEVLKQKQTLLMPIGGDDAFLLQYSALARLDTGSNPLMFDAASAAQVLNFIKRAHDAGIIPETAIGVKSVEETWLPFAANQVAMAQVSASRYLAEREKTPNALFAPVPTRDGKIATLVTGWGFAITAREPARQAASARFIQWMIQGDRLAPWLRAARRLPGNRAALALAVDPPEYAVFLRDALERATFSPSVAGYAKSAEAWRAAIPAVWKGQLTPEEAARNIAAVK